MKTTLDIQDQLLANAKAAAAMQRTTLTRLIEEGLAMRLAASAIQKSSGQRLTLPLMTGKGGLKGGFNPVSNKSVLDAMDQ